jgi:hypothetical protein
MRVYFIYPFPGKTNYRYWKKFWTKVNVMQVTTRIVMAPPERQVIICES